MDWKVVPIERWPGPMTGERRKHPFRKQSDRWRGSTVQGVDWDATMSLLDHELWQLDAKSVVLQMAVERRHIRKDGWIKATASPEHPGIILSFDSKHGPLSYPCDTFTEWKGNLRAIAKGLEDLRRLERYGITKTGQQYTGWLQIPAKTSAESPESVLARVSGLSLEDVQANPKAAYRKAAKRTHPDYGGTDEEFSMVADAARLVGAL